MKLATIGMNAETGKPIKFADHLRQSIECIITTPIGSRVCRREFGSHLSSLIDSAVNPEGLQRLRAAICQSLITWEPRLLIDRVELKPDASGRLRALIRGSTRYGSASFDVSVTASEGLSA